jgi:hypothetical protein
LIGALQEGAKHPPQGGVRQWGVVLAAGTACPHARRLRPGTSTGRLQTRDAQSGEPTPRSQASTTTGSASGQGSRRGGACPDIGADRR